MISFINVIPLLAIFAIIIAIYRHRRTILSTRFITATIHLALSSLRTVYEHNLWGYIVFASGLVYYLVYTNYWFNMFSYWTSPDTETYAYPINVIPIFTITLEWWIYWEYRLDDHFIRSSDFIDQICVLFSKVRVSRNKVVYHVECSSWLVVRNHVPSITYNDIIELIDIANISCNFIVLRVNFPYSWNNIIIAS